MNCRTKPLRIFSRRANGGFALIEALVAFLVVAFGMLALAGMQTTLARGSDLAKQRSEAVRLAQLKMEELRAYDSIVSGSGTWNYATNIVAGSDAAFTPTNSNTAFTRSWTVTGPDGSTAAGANDAQKWVHVTVQWADRSSATLNQSVRLDSTIARNNPIELKGITNGQALPKARQPKNRNINVPYPAVTLSGGTQSAFAPPPGATAYVFDNASGNIVKSCPVPTANISTVTRSGSTVTVTTTAPHSFVVGNRVAIVGVASTPASLYNGSFTVTSPVTSTMFSYTSSSGTGTGTGGTATYQLAEGLNLASSGLTCTNITAYLLSGFVRFTDATGDNQLAAAAQNSTDTTRELNATTPLTFTDPSGTLTGRLPSAQSCFAQRQKVVSTPNVNPATISSMTRANGTVTVTTSSAHGFPANARIATEGLSDFSFEGTFEIVSVPSTTTLTYLQPSADASVSGTASSKIKLIQQITVAESQPVPSAYNQTESTFVSYACVVTPVDDDNNAATPVAWWGKVDLNPLGWVIGTGGYKVCRYSGDYISSGTGAGVVSNSEHPNYYRRVTGALDGQNFLVIPIAASCPGDTPVVYTGSVADLYNANTVPHQPTAEFSYQCLSVNNSNQCSGANKQSLESTTVTDTVLMF
jgi:Tfp pilus assembly protein PilV